VKIVKYHQLETGLPPPTEPDRAERQNNSAYQPAPYSYACVLRYCHDQEARPLRKVAENELNASAFTVWLTDPKIQLTSFTDGYLMSKF
jgi:hypothetical protein